MKTKIIYISGSEIFDIADIRAAFEEVRNALNLDKTTVLFGVPVDAEDAGITTTVTQPTSVTTETKSVKAIKEPTENIDIIETVTEIINEPIVEEEIKPEEKIESVEETQTKKRGRPRKEEKTESIIETLHEQTSADTDETKEAVVPILSVLATKEEIIGKNQDDDIEIIPDIPDEIAEDKTEQENQDTEIVEDDEAARLEKLLSAMTPLEEDILEGQPDDEPVVEQNSMDTSFDATLEQLATEFAENQDKIAVEAKSSSRSKIGKLRNILPFKQSKHKDQGLGDLFGWAGMAANDEDFSVPGFFTSTAAKK